MKRWNRWKVKRNQNSSTNDSIYSTTAPNLCRVIQLCFGVLVTFLILGYFVEKIPNMKTILKPPPIRHQSVRSIVTSYQTSVFQVKYNQMDQQLLYNTTYCELQCFSNTPCQYKDEVDFRVIVITYNRPGSLKKCLYAFLDLDMQGDRTSVEIWIDRYPKSGGIDKDTLNVAVGFADIFMGKLSLGRVCIHIQPVNVGIQGQWMDTWRPKSDNTKEIGLILEDDNIISPLAYKWLRLLHNNYDRQHSHSIAGYTLQTEDLYYFALGSGGKMQGPSNHQIFLYPVIGTWGFSPHPRSWRNFQDWYENVRPSRNSMTDKIKPYVPNIVPTDWYRTFESQDRQNDMWEMWHIKYTHDLHLYTVYPNLERFTGSNVLLNTNNRAQGLHYARGPSVDHSDRLIKVWDRMFDKLPTFEELIHYNYDGHNCTSTCCFNTQC